MKTFDNVPDVVPLDDESAFGLSIARAWLYSFPPELRRYARLNPSRLHLAIESKQISVVGLVISAYVGFAALPISFSRFVNEVRRVYELEADRSEFLENEVAPENSAVNLRELLKDEVARENTAAREFGMSRGELKRLFTRLDHFAQKFAGVDSYGSVFNCKNEILNDQSVFAPTDREAYAEGPLYLWDFAKAVDEHDLVDMSFGTFRGWVLFVHLKNGVVTGYAVHPRALRLGNFTPNPLIDFDGLRLSAYPRPIMDVPQEVRAATYALANRHFPDRPFHFMLPPLAFLGDVYSSKPILNVRRISTEA